MRGWVDRTVGGEETNHIPAKSQFWPSRLQTFSPLPATHEAIYIKMKSENLDHETHLPYFIIIIIIYKG
jgi:hypothetical protein